MMTRATPTQARKALEVANVFVKAGVRFVPMPCADDDEYDRLTRESMAKLEALEQAAAKQERQQAIEQQVRTAAVKPPLFDRDPTNIQF